MCTSKTTTQYMITLNKLGERNNVKQFINKNKLNTFCKGHGQASYHYLSTRNILDT